MLTHPDFDRHFDLTTDASNYAIGAVLSQERRPIQFLSRTLTKTEENDTTNEKELLAIVWALTSLIAYLYGSKKVIIYPDHQPLIYALSNKDSNNKLKRWKSIIEEYDYELKYKPGSTNVVTDTLINL
jgi:ribonuclease HI